MQLRYIFIFLGHFQVAIIITILQYFQFVNAILHLQMNRKTLNSIQKLQILIQFE